MSLSRTTQQFIYKEVLWNAISPLGIALFLLVIIFFALYYGKLIFGHRIFTKSKDTLDFTHIKPRPDFNFKEIEPREYRPWKAGKYNMTMGIRGLQEDDWLTIDSLYEQEQSFRRTMLENKREEVLQYRPESEPACEEALECVVGFLTKRYPSQFQLSEDKVYIFNAITKRTFRIVAPYDHHPLEIAAQLAMEDINLMIRGNGDDYYLRASVTLFPAGWYLRERLGWALWQIHAPVPFWNEKLKKAMKNFFLRLKVANPVERNNFFVQVGDNIFQQEPFPESLPDAPKIEEINIRYERQTLRRLPRTGAVIFTVRTYIKPLTCLRDELDSVRSLRSAIKAWPPEMGKYKGRNVWGDVVDQWCEEVLTTSHLDEEEEKGVGARDGKDGY